ncbi:MAG: aminotransferase class III-fold pyridoxal phosphate-dependent enzyme [Phycisphaerae bacterium]|nr:aminotransferase class III-fold pyridoxal phosphate-dependent enzyme [Phycisphaerae bacterium]
MTTTQTPTPTSAATELTAGERLAANPRVREAVDAALKELRAASAQITEARPPLPGRKQGYEDLMARAAAARGRPLLYPMLGSGVGNGPLVELADGSVKWDMICGIGVHFFGHSDADLAERALVSGLDDTLKHGNLQSNFEPYRFAEVLLEQARKSSRLKYSYLATGGAMANENALKVCFQKKYLDQVQGPAGGAAVKPEVLLANTTPSMRVLAFQDCFMGRSLVMAQIGDSHQGREGLPNGVFVDYVPFWDPWAAERLGPGPQGKARFIDAAVKQVEQYARRYPGGHACFIFELAQGEGGFNVGDRDFFKALMDACRAHRIAIWDDEIQTFGRTPRMFAYEHFDLGDYVDVLCVGKMTQACATLWTEEFNPRSALLSGTFTGEGVSFRVGQRVIERLADPANGYFGERGHFARHHALFRSHARALIQKHPEWFPPVDALNGGGDRLVDGLGGMMRLTPFGGRKDKVQAACKACFEEGVIVFYCGHGPYHLRMLPPLPAMRDEHWPKVFACLEKGLARAAG